MIRFDVPTSIMPYSASAPEIFPEHIAAGIGLADRREICGLLGLLEASGFSEILKEVAVSTKRRLDSKSAPEPSSVEKLSKSFLDGPQSTDALRSRLWLAIKQSLGLPGLFPLSMGGIGMDAAAMGVRAAEILGPSLIGKRNAATKPASGSSGDIGRKMLGAISRFRPRASEAVGFPDIVAAEMKAMMDGVVQVDLEGTLDPEVATALREGQSAMTAAALAGGGWVAVASVIGSAGFAPYMVAAQLSAVVPFVTGPALVSLLAVMINPVTVVAGTAGLVYWAAKGKVSSVQRVAAARVVILMALIGMQDRVGGIAALATVFRQLHDMPRHDLDHLNQEQYGELVQRARRLEQRLMGKAPPAMTTAPGNWGRPLPTKEGTSAVDTGLVGALTAGDMLYHAAAIDPAVLAAADFSRLSSIGSPLELATHVSSFATQGAEIGLRGYTAEQLVMARLIEQGHAVELAADSTMPGYDLIVDGVPVQVKCGTSLSLLKEHFSKYPDIPVIADIDLAQSAETAGAAWAHLVTTVDGFELDHVQQIVERSLDTAQSLGENMVPVYAMIVGGARAVSKAWKGEIPVEDLPAWLILDLSIRGGLSATGHVAGAFAGLLVIGPAGALVLGPVAGVAALFGTRSLHDQVDHAIRRPWHAEVMEASDELRTTLVRACERQVDMLAKRRARLKRSNPDVPADLMSWINGCMAEDVIFACERLEDIRPITAPREAMELMLLASIIGMRDLAVLEASKRLSEQLRKKPSTTASMKRLGDGAKTALRDRFS